MAKKTIVETFDDLTGDRIDANIVPNPTISFAIDGVEYEIDLGSKNRDKFYSALEPYLQSARKVGRRAGRRSSGAGSGASGLSRSELGKIREWAQKAGRNVSARGRLPKDLIEAYQKENS